MRNTASIGIFSPPDPPAGQGVCILGPDSAAGSGRAHLSFPYRRASPLWCRWPLSRGEGIVFFFGKEEKRRRLVGTAMSVGICLTLSRKKMGGENRLPEPEGRRILSGIRGPPDSLRNRKTAGFSQESGDRWILCGTGKPLNSPRNLRAPSA